MVIALRFFFPALVALSVPALPFPASASTWNVSPDGLGDAPTIQAAIDSAAPGDTVLLADGIFSGPGNRDIEFLGKEIVVRSAGGDPGACVVRCDGAEGDEHRGFAFRAGEGRSAVLEGLTVTGGFAGASLNNRAGAILVASGCSPTIRSCVLIANRATNFGGAIIIGGTAAPLLSGCRIQGNFAGLDCGGASIGSADSTLTISDCVFDRNEAGRDAGGLGAFELRGSIIGCTFTGNSAEGCGGGAYFWAGTGSVTDCRFLGNTAQQVGAGLHWEFQYLTQYEPLLVSSCEFSGNAAAAFGGGVYARFYYGEFAVYAPPLEIVNCTFYDNAAQAGGSGIGVEGYGWAYLQEPPRVQNTILAFGSEGNAVQCAPWSDDLPPTLVCCDLYGNAGSDWVGCIADQFGMQGNFSADPLFCDAAGGIFTLDAASLCADAPGCGLVGAYGVGCDVVTAVETAESVPAGEPRFLARPNPTRSGAVIEFALGGGVRSFTVHDIRGRLVRTIESSAGSSGSIFWDGTDASGRSVAPGTYFLRAAAAGKTHVQRVVVVR